MTKENSKQEQPQTEIEKMSAIEIEKMFANEIAKLRRSCEETTMRCLEEAKRNILDEVNACLNSPEKPPTLRFTALAKSDELKPEVRDGRLWLRYAPKPSHAGRCGLSVGPNDPPRRLSTGVTLSIPDGYAALVCQVEEAGAKQRYLASELLFGETIEVEVVYRASQHHLVNVGRVIGCMLLVRVGEYAVDAAK